MSGAADPLLSTILDDVVQGRAGTHELLPVMYKELRRVAEARLRRLPPGQTLQPTALVHEAYLALAESSQAGWSGRAHFFGAAARAMNEILIDQARRKSADKRNKGQRPLGLDHAELLRAVAPSSEDVLAVSGAIKKLDADHPRQAEVVLLRTLVGMTDVEIAELLGVTTRTVERDFRFGRAFLARELSR